MILFGMIPCMESLLFTCSLASQGDGLMPLGPGSVDFLISANYRPLAARLSGGHQWNSNIWVSTTSPSVPTKQISRDSGGPGGGRNSSRRASRRSSDLVSLFLARVFHCGGLVRPAM